MGFTFVYRLHDETGAPISAIVRAYAIATEIFSLDLIWKEIESLDNKVPSEAQITMMMSFIRLMRRATRWFLRNRRGRLDIASAINEFSEGIKDVKKFLPSALVGDEKDAFDKNKARIKNLGGSENLANELACVRGLFSALDIIAAANHYDFKIKDVVNVYFAMGDQLKLSWIRTQVIAHTVENHWEALTREALRDDLDWQQKQLTVAILMHNGSIVDINKLLEKWRVDYELLVGRWEIMLSDLQANIDLNYTMFFVAIRELLDLTQTSFQAAMASQETKK